QAVRSKVDFLTLCKTPELAAEVTIQPVERLKVDVAILFSDILVVVEPMGMKLEFCEAKGPVLHDPIRNEAGVRRLRTIKPAADLPYVTDTIKILTKELKVPLIGFSGAPFTLATYMIEGGSSRNYIHMKRMMYSEPETFKLLMDKTTDVVISYLKAQIDAGVNAVQVFDSWAGILSPVDFEIFALPYVQRIIAELKAYAPTIPVIFFAFNTSGMVERVKKSGADVIGLDWRIDMSDAIARLGTDVSVQGNLDPCTLFGKKEVIREKVGGIIKGAQGAKGHIFNLGHGILPETPVENAIAMVEAVHELSSR
ncbi:MAG: uroporphyrinogen decarboxylase, partial [Thermodesulfovibrionales bacterium]